MKSRAVPDIDPPLTEPEGDVAPLAVFWYIMPCAQSNTARTLRPFRTQAALSLMKIN